MTDLIERVARAIWGEMRRDEDRCDMELEDMGEDHRVWAYARAALDAMPGWQPIETAPPEIKDGREILVFGDVAGEVHCNKKNVVATAQWDKDSKSWDVTNTDYYGVEAYPRLWMPIQPLPSPPALKEGN